MATAAIAETADKKPFYKSLYFQVVIGILLGITLGYLAPETAQAMKPLGDGFIKLIKMMIGPIIFCTVVSGIAGMNSMKTAGRIGIKALVYFEVMSTFALVIGLVVVNYWQPGASIQMDAASLDTKAVEAYTGKAAQELSSTSDFLLHMIPSSMVGAFTSGDILQVLVVSILFALALLAVGERASPVYDFINQISSILFAMIGFIVKLSPLGAFGAMAFTVGKYGTDSLVSLFNLMLCFYLTCFLFIMVVLGTVMRLIGLRMLPFLKYIRDELFIVFGTSSSESALPNLIRKMTAFGCSKSVVGMVVPTGYSFNLDGTSIYLTMAAIFVAQASGMDLTLGQELTLLGVLLLTSKGAAGVTGSGFVVLAGTLSVVGHIPVEGLALLLGIDRFMSEARALTNLVGNAVATVVVARWENGLDMKQARQILSEQ